jgi:serine/threonine protein kinase
MTLDDNYYSIRDMVVPEEHARWILSRLLEFSAYMQNAGYVHVGLTIDSFLVNPKTHGVKIISFYHMKPINSKLKTVSAKYRLMYPAAVFAKKLAESKIDIELAKRTACFLLGDTSGIGVKLKKTVSSPLMQFLIQTNNDSVEGFFEYRKMLKANYEVKFYEFSI